MATINSKTFNVQSQSTDSVTLVESTSSLATPYSVKLGRTLPKAVKGSVLRGAAKVTYMYLDAENNPQQAILTISSSIPANAPASVLDALKADLKADIAAAGGIILPCVFNGKIYQ